ncbi:MAG TPA: hypothetical protein VHX44_12775 [Planctomycetota bacterium]|jgi:hypothetical protein|nr:hypothetical protein [Planctomycetota bacterium]
MTADIWKLIDTAGLAELDRGPRAGVAAAASVKRVLAGALAGLSVERRDAALGLALLWHDDLDGAHALCQAHEGHADCDYVHALLHRREGDFANAKYWFREVGPHPVYATVAKAAADLGQPGLVAEGQWRPAAMVDACATALGRDPAQRPVLMQVQAAEFRALAAYVFTH